MKLLFCPDCFDIIKLDFEYRSCKCKHSNGYYHKNGTHAIVSGKAVCIGIDNNTFADAFRSMRDNPALSEKGAYEMGNFRAWVFHREHSSRIEYKT
jgi:hypothetical protein